MDSREGPQGFCWVCSKVKCMIYTINLMFKRLGVPKLSSPIAMWECNFPSGLDFQSTSRGWWCSPRKSRYFVISDLSWFYLKLWTSGEKASGVSERHLLPLGLCRRVKIFSLSKLKTQIFLFAVLPNHQNVSIFRIQVCGGGRGPTNRTGWIWAGFLGSCQ